MMLLVDEDYIGIDLPDARADRDACQAIG